MDERTRLAVGKVGDEIVVKRFPDDYGDAVWRARLPDGSTVQHNTPGGALDAAVPHLADVAPSSDMPIPLCQQLALCKCGLWFRATTKERAQDHLAKHVNGQEDPEAHGFYDPTANPPQAGGAQPCS